MAIMWLLRGFQNRYQAESTEFANPSGQHLLAVRPHPSRLLRLPFKRRGGGGGSGDGGGGKARRGAEEAGRNRHADGEKMAILIRSDIRIGPGRMANYAAGIAVRLFQKACLAPHACAAWNAAGQHKVVLKVEGEDAVSNFVHRARDDRLSLTGIRIRSNRQTEQSRKRGYTWIAIGVFGPSSVIDRLTNGFKPF